MCDWTVSRFLTIAHAWKTMADCMARLHGKGTAIHDSGCGKKRRLYIYLVQFNFPCQKIW